MAKHDVALGVLETAFRGGGEYEAGDGIKAGVLEAQAALFDGQVGNDVGVGWQ